MMGMTRLAVGMRRLAVDTVSLAVGMARLATGMARLAVGTPRASFDCCCCHYCLLGTGSGRLKMAVGWPRSQGHL